MKKSSLRYISSTGRKLKNFDYAMRFYGLWTLLTVVLFGFYGIRPLYSILMEKRALIKEIEETNIALGENIRSLEEVKQDLYDQQESLQHLEKFMPSTYDTQNYLLDFMSSISTTGYNLSRFYPNSGFYKDKLELSVLLEGRGNISLLIKNIEEMKRITQLERVFYKKPFGSSQKLDKVNLTISIYSTEAK